MLIKLLVLFVLQPQAIPPPSADRAALARLETVWNEAHVRSDAEALDGLWAAELVVTVAEMPVRTKAESMAIRRSGRMRFGRYETSDLRIDVYQDAAVVTGRLRRARDLGGRTVDDDWRFTKVYVRRSGMWKVVAWHGSPSAQ